MTYEELTLGHLIMKTVRPEDLDIDKSLFSDKKHRLIFSEIQKSNGDLDVAELSIRLKGKVSPVYISGLIDGVPKSDARNVPRYINKIRVERLRIESLRLIEKGAKSGNFDHDEIRLCMKKYQDWKHRPTESLPFHLY